MPVYETPGLYYERVDASAPGIAAVRTDIAGFVGIARRGPLHAAIPVQSWRQFAAYFGEFTGAGYLAYAVRAFFENGGRRCWVVRVASEIAAAAGVDLRGPAPAQDEIWRVSAFSPGVWGNDLEIAVRETHRAQTVSDPAGGRPEYSVVPSTAGFARGTLVRLLQGTMQAWKVVSDVDAGERNREGEKRLLWVHPQPESRLPYDSPLPDLDLGSPVLIESVEYTLQVRELGRLVRGYEGLSLVPEHPRYGPLVLAPLALPQETGAPAVLPAAPEPVVIEELRVLETLPLAGFQPLAVDPGAALPLSGGTDGLALLGVGDFIGEPGSPFESDAAAALGRRGLRALEDVGEVAVLAIPDIHIQPVRPPERRPLPPCTPDPCLPPPPPAPAASREPSTGDLPPVFSEREVFQVQAAMVQQCEARRDRVAVLDPPFAAARDDALGIGAIRAWRSRFDTRYAALYYPWLRVVDPLRASPTRDVPPSGHVAGQYARTDLAEGVHKAPANAPLAWVQDVTVLVDDAVQAVLNPSGINAIRPLRGRGIRIYGARTVSSDPDWRFVNVRRLLLMIEKAIDASIQWAVFEPNHLYTRAKLRLALTSFLGSLWQRGALMGASPDEAFFVRCDEENNPPSERDQGRLLASVGVAPSKPFEFIVLRVGRAGNEFEIMEAG